MELSALSPPLFQTAQEWLHAARSSPDITQFSIQEQPSSSRLIRVMHVTFEFASARTGGLGSVTSGLIPAQNQLKDRFNAKVITPSYDFIDVNKSRVVGQVTNYYSGEMVTSTILKMKTLGVTHYLVQPCDEEHRSIFRVGTPNAIYKIFESSRLINRICYFAGASAAFMAQYQGKNGLKRFDVVNYHSYTSGFGAALFREVYAQKLYALHRSVPGIVVTHHDSMNSGEWHVGAARLMGLHREGETIDMMLESNRAADCVVGVAKGYIDYLCNNTPDGSLKESFQTKRDQNRLVGILNGIQVDAYHPLSNPKLGPLALCEGMSVQSWKRRLKQYLVESGCISDAEKMLYVFLGRFSLEKGVDVLAAAKETILKSGGAFIVMGKPSVDLSAMEHINHLTEAPSPDFYLIDTAVKQAELGEIVRGAADVFIVCSHLEACGVVPMEGFCTGALTISSDVQGLKDYMRDLSEHEDGNGFIYQEAGENSQNLVNCIKRAYDYFQALSSDDKETLQVRLMTSARKYDWSAGDRLEQYYNVYQMWRS